MWKVLRGSKTCFWEASGGGCKKIFSMGRKWVSSKNGGVPGVLTSAGGGGGPSNGMSVQLNLGLVWGGKGGKELTERWLPLRGGRKKCWLQGKS